MSPKTDADGRCFILVDDHRLSVCAAHTCGHLTAQHEALAIALPSDPDRQSAIYPLIRSSHMPLAALQQPALQAYVQCQIAITKCER